MGNGWGIFLLQTRPSGFGIQVQLTPLCTYDSFWLLNLLAIAGENSPATKILEIVCTWPCSDNMVHGVGICAPKIYGVSSTKT